LKNPLGIILIVIGLIIIVWGAFGFKTRERVIDVGPLHATKETTHHVPYGPIAGAIVLIGGVVLLVSGRR
jgi:drug/metabolite transporter (DMT)-like permease